MTEPFTLTGEPERPPQAPVEVAQLDLFAPGDLHRDRQRPAQARFWEPTIMDYEQEVKTHG